MVGDLEYFYAKYLQGMAWHVMEMQGKARHVNSRFVPVVLLKMKNGRDGTRNVGQKIGAQ
jgi:hypothetical protein